MQADSRSTPASWTRREFVRGAGGLLAVPYLRSGAAGKQDRQFAYIASCPRGEEDSGTICVLSCTPGDRWPSMQRVPSRAPAYLLLSPANGVLYVANEVAIHEGLPRGTVEAFRIHPEYGSLSLLGRAPLSLSATRPRHMALSPDGKWLAVAAYGGGIYNLLPVAADGSLGAPSGIFKEAGCGPHAALQASAHPHTLCFDGSGKQLLSSDFGSDRLNVFAVQDGRLIRKSSRSAGAGTGPGACLLHPAGFFFASHDLDHRIGCYRYDPASGSISEGPHVLGAAHSLALHPLGHTLYAADDRNRALYVWRVDQRSGNLLLIQELSTGHAMHVSVAPDGQSVYILDGVRGRLMRCAADPITGQLGAATNLAEVSAPRSIVMHTI